MTNQSVMESESKAGRNDYDAGISRGFGRILKRIGIMALVVLLILFFLWVLFLVMKDNPQRVDTLLEISHSYWWFGARYILYGTVWLYLPCRLRRAGLSESLIKSARRPIFVSIVLCEFLAIVNLIIQ